MEFDILDSLDDLGYPDCAKGDSKVKNAIEVGPKSVEFTHLIEWLSKELQSICGLESCINSITDPEDSSSFLVEVSSFLKELQCPYKSLITGSISQRLQDLKSRILLLDFLCTELQAARLIHSKRKKENSMETEVVETSVISDLNNIVRSLKINTDVEDPLLILSEMEKKISSNLDMILPPALTEHLSGEQWASLTDEYNDMYIEYGIRRELLLTRLDVTIQSFKWGERCQNKESEILNAYVHKRKKLKRDPAVKITDVIAAREDIFIIEKTSSAELVKNTKSSLNRVLIDAVPDRGGRPKEQKPPLEMPNWSKRSRGSGGGGGRGGFRGRGGGEHRGHGKRFKDHKNDSKGSGSFDAAGAY